MDLPNLGTNPELDDIMQRARKYDIEENLLDLAMYGFTVVPPEKLGTTELTGRLRTAILKVYEDRSGHKIDDWQTFDGKMKKFQNWGWLLEDDVFLEAMHNPVYQTIGQFLTGMSGFLAGAAVILKTRQQEFDLPLHSDSHGVPPPWPSFAAYANLSWLLTDYLDAEDGPTVLVPGSQRGRMPRGPPSWCREASADACHGAANLRPTSTSTTTSNRFPYKDRRVRSPSGLAPCGTDRFAVPNRVCGSPW